jgi:aminodeoxyfutalosine deaminase
MILRARVIVSMDGPPIENGVILVSGDRILDVGKFRDLSAQHSGQEIVDLGERAVLPGLINAHCHLDYTCLRSKIPSPKSFTDWIRTINVEKAKLVSDDCVVSINEGFAEAKRFGTTTIANLTAFPELISRIDSPIRTWWLAELIDIRNPKQARECVDSAVESLRAAQNWGLAPHAPFTASAGLYRRCEEIAARDAILLTTHLAESREELWMFRDTKGPLYDFLKEIGRDMSDCGAGTPLNRFEEIIGRDGPLNSPRATQSRSGTVSRPYLQWIIAHFNELAETDFDLLKQAGTNFSIVHCPRSHSYFDHSPFQCARLRELGFNICLGTDSLASNEDLSLFSEMRAFQKRFPDVAVEEILAMVTVNAARALRQENALGRIRPGCYADLIAIPRVGATNAFQEILSFDETVPWMMVGGVIQKAG